jgi:hypothetical protein
MEFYTDNSNDRPYKKGKNTPTYTAEKKSSHDYEYWQKKNKKIVY